MDETNLEENKAIEDIPVEQEVGNGEMAKLGLALTCPNKYSPDFGKTAKKEVENPSMN